MAGCTNGEGTPPTSGDCMNSSFKKTYLRNFQKDDIFLIKGVALDVFEYGREIKVIEDLKGNLAGKSSVFVWGGGHSSNPQGAVISNERMDNLSLYNKNDTLIMCIGIIQRANDIEKTGDYGTLQCSPCVLQLSNGYVTGQINNWDRTTMPWKELQEELQAFLNLEEKPSWWLSNWSIPDAFYTVYKAFSKYDGGFLIQGLVLEPQNQYGKKIQVITDYNGSFPKETTDFIVWGLPEPAFSYCTFDRFDDLRLYNDQDTLLMLLLPATDYFCAPNINEKKEDYTTFPLAHSVLKLSNNSVSGYITSFYEKETMSWEEFQELLNLTKETQQ